MERLREKEEKEVKKKQRLKERFADLLYSIKVIVIHYIEFSFYHYFYMFAVQCNTGDVHLFR